MTECLIQDHGAAGLSLTGVLEQDTFILAKYWLNQGRPVPTLLKIVEWDVKNQIKQKA